IHSSLGEAGPRNIVVLPLLFEGQTKAVIELASLQEFTATHLAFLEQLTQSIGVVLNTIEATMRTEGLLTQSQQLTAELQTRQTAAKAGGNHCSRRFEWARTINYAGSELLNLINDILDLSKIESGTVTVEAEETPFAVLGDIVEGGFRHVAESKNLPFHIEFG